jgi:hypothetical protein
VITEEVPAVEGPRWHGCRSRTCHGAGTYSPDVQRQNGCPAGSAKTGQQPSMVAVLACPAHVGACRCSLLAIMSHFALEARMPTPLRGRERLLPPNGGHCQFTHGDWRVARRSAPTRLPLVSRWLTVTTPLAVST